MLATRIALALAVAGCVETSAPGSAADDCVPDGALAKDRSGNDHTGRLVGGAWMRPGVEGGALRLDGVNDAVAVPGLLGEPRSVTLSAWVDLRRADGEVISLGDCVSLRLDDDDNGGTKGFFWDGADWHTTGVLEKYTGKGWHHFAYVVDGAAHVQRFYADGIEKEATTAPQSVSYVGCLGDTRLGQHASGEGYELEGDLDEVRVYGRALSHDEVGELVVVPAGGTREGLAARWAMDDGC